LKKFVDQAHAVASWIEKATGVLNTSGNLEAQLNAVSSFDTQPGYDLLQELVATDAHIAAANIKSNPYTDLTLASVKSRLEEVVSVKKSKESNIQQEILAKQNSSASPEQIAEFKDVFKHFDKNSTNSLSKLEFKSVLQSLGEDPSDSKMEALMAELADVDVASEGGSSKQIGFNNFLTYMIKISSDTSSHDEISAAFSDLSSGKDYVTADDLRKAGLGNDKVEYLLKHLPAFPGVDNAYDYKKFSSHAFN